MGLFGKKKDRDEIAFEQNEEDILKEELKTEVEELQNQFRVKQEEIKEITQKVQTVKEEYDTTVSNLMAVKKELNQKKMELDVSQREYKEIRDRIRKSADIKDTKDIEEFNKTKERLEKLKDELSEKTRELEDIKEKTTEEKSLLHNIRKQQIEAEKELDEANSRLYNAKEELDKEDQFQDMNILSSEEKQFIQGNEKKQKNTDGIIEAASAVVGSLKSKLNMTQKELEAIQILLEKEREEHEQTKKKLEEFKNSTKE